RVEEDRRLAEGSLHSAARRSKIRRARENRAAPVGMTGLVGSAKDPSRCSLLRRADGMTGLRQEGKPKSTGRNACATKSREMRLVGAGDHHREVVGLFAGTELLDGILYGGDESGWRQGTIGAHRFY